MKKLISLVLALAMVALCAVASAATITINQPTPADGTAGTENYTIYKIFDVRKASTVSDPVTTQSNVNSAGTATGFSYTIASDSDWVSVLGGFTGTDGAWVPAANQTYVTLVKIPGDTSKYNVVATNGLDSTAEAKAFASFLLENKGSIAATDTITSNGTTATYSGDDGYYLITSTLGTNLILATSNIEINTKNEYVTDTKTTPKTDHKIGDLVPYTITVNLPASIDYTKPVIVHDTMDSVLTLDTTSVHAKVTTDNDFDSYLTLVTENFGDNHHADHAAATGKTIFDFVLNINSLAPGANETATAKTITITYNAELTSGAAADTNYVNEEFTEYSKYKTTPNDVIVKTFDFDLDKTFAGVDTANQGNYQATFALYAENGTTAINLIQETEYVAYHLPSTGETASTNQFKVLGGGSVNVKGLDAGTYKVKEISTSNGFNTMTDVITVVIDENGDVTYTIGNGNAATGHITVENQSGTVLPSTGGIGTTIFYIVGGMLLVGAAIVLVARRKASEN